MSPYDVIKTARLTEKGTLLSEKFNRYILVVDRRANKIQIRKAVEELFKVTVTEVRTMNMRGKKRRQHRPDAGRSAHWKKAIVTLKKGDQIVLT